MNESIKAVQGIAEKIPASLTAPLMVRVVFPGLLVAAFLYPFVSHIPGFWAVLLTFKINGTSYNLHSGLLLLALSSLLWGTAVTTLNSLIYSIYCGRSFWPRRLEISLTNRREAKVRALQLEAENLKKREAENLARLERGNLERLEAENLKVENLKIDRRYNQLWYKLRAYPIGADGDPHAVSPTRIGNILKEFQSYPKSRYGMDGVFYWKRIWLSLDKDRRKEIDSKWCIGDGLLYTSAICGFGAILWIVAALVSFLGWPPGEHLPFFSRLGSLIGGIVLLLAGLLMYVVDLPFQRANSDIFKIVFDIYRPQVFPVLTWGPAESRRWRGAWAYLNYLWIDCAVCKNSYSALLPRCEVCNYVTELSVRALGDQKKSPSDDGASPQFISAENIRRRAYEIYEQRQYKDGFALDDWLRAENELMR